MAEAALREETRSNINAGGASRGHRLRQGSDRAAKRIIGDLEGAWREPGRRAEGEIDVVDLFSGCGGMSAGFQLANTWRPSFRLAAAVEIDPTANETYEMNLGLRPDPLDVGQIAMEPEQIRELGGGLRDGNPWVLVGCAPCQGFSSYRNKSKGGDARNTLFGHVVTVAESLLPDVVVMENVPELVTNRYWPYVEDARARLTTAGYSVNIGVHNCAEHGVPQERFRFVLVAMRDHFLPLRPRLERSEFRSVRDAIGDLPAIGPGERIESDPFHYTARHKPSTVEVLRAVPKDGGNRPPGVGPDCLRDASERQGKPVYEDVYGRLHWGRPSVTITNFSRNPASGRFIHPSQDRGLSVREAACLQSFPRSFEFSGTLDPCFRQIGNAVPPLFSASLALQIASELQAVAPIEFDHGLVSPVGSSFSRLIPSLKRGTRQLSDL